MDKLQPDSKPNLCLLAFELNHDLAIMAGECELLVNGMDADAQLARQLRRLLELTFAMAKKINGHNCRMVTCVARNPNHYFGDTETTEPPAVVRAEKQ